MFLDWLVSAVSIGLRNALQLNLLYKCMYLYLWRFVSTGSGIPEMKTILRGIRIPGYLNIKTFISKSVSPHMYRHVTLYTIM